MENQSDMERILLLTPVTLFYCFSYAVRSAVLYVFSLFLKQLPQLPPAKVSYHFAASVQELRHEQHTLRQHSSQTEVQVNADSPNSHLNATQVSRAQREETYQPPRLKSHYSKLKLGNSSTNQRCPWHCTLILEDPILHMKKITLFFASGAKLILPVQMERHSCSHPTCFASMQICRQLWILGLCSVDRAYVQ